MSADIDSRAIPGPNLAYLVDQYERYLDDPSSVPPEQRELFRKGLPRDVVGRPAPAEPAERGGQPPGLASLVRAIRDQGHRAARIDPLDLRTRDESTLSPARHGVEERELERLPAEAVDTPLARDASSAREVVAGLRALYCGTSGYEFFHVRDDEERRWLYDAVESGLFRESLDAGASRELLERLSQVEGFEEFVRRSFPGEKWFAIEGTEALVPLLDWIVRYGGEAGVRQVVMGMAHRGRLNVLAHVLDVSYAEVLASLKGLPRAGVNGLHAGEEGWMSDAEYHYGAVTTRNVGPAGDVTVTLLANPSHVELVDPVVLGAARALQEARGHDPEGAGRPDPASAMAVVIHGDAGFAGEGIVAETLNFSQLAGFNTGGTVHVVTNNQLGFTTEPIDGRSGPYATDSARGYDVPVVHVNGDDLEACSTAARLAVAYRSRFGKDFVIDLVGYRRLGHNEADEPSFTQPLMYQTIRDHPTARALWAERCRSEGVVSGGEAQGMEREVWARLREALGSLPTDGASPPTPQPPDARAGGREPETAVSAERLRALNRELHGLPDGFTMHPRLGRPMQRRREALEGDGRVEWAHAEALAFASLLSDGVPVRLTGQDTERGTFSQRHAVLHDARTGERFTPLQAMPSARAPFAVFNSPLSEEAVLGFEYGYTLLAPGALVVWEAQFGDFVNNAQAIIDEFIASAWAKWGQRSGLVLLLPHGYEGQGPNHSSAGLERFLQLAAEGNIRVANCTTAGQYFHLLRRQGALLQQDPRPLVVMTPKSLLRHPLAMSEPGQLSSGRFQPVIGPGGGQEDAGLVRRLVLCSGKVFADLVAREAYSGAAGMAVARVEELYPFPSAQLSDLLERYRRVDEMVWVQEEPRNRGAWSFVRARLEPLLPEGVRLRYVGRPPRSSQAEGMAAVHKAEQARIVEEALAPRAGAGTAGGER